MQEGRRLAKLASLVALSMSLVITTLLLASSFGSFSGNVRAEWTGGKRKMKLLEDFSYTDPEGRVWTAPKGSIVDGASIPRLLWTPVGGPFEGEYRNASVVHDVACNERKVSWRDVHRMFYFACRSGGVAETKAKLMFAAVYHFGPRWAEKMIVQPISTDAEPFEMEILMPRTVMPEELDKLKAFIETSNPDLDAIEGFSGGLLH